jgi:hypothetical protein
MTGNPNIWYAVFVDPRGKQYPEDDTYRTVYFDFNQPRTPPDLAREALRKRCPEIADKARMVQLAAWGRGIKGMSQF